MISRVTKSELLDQLRRIDESSALLLDIADQLHASPPDVHAQYERALACALARSGDLAGGRLHFERATRIYEGLHSAPGLLELSRAWEDAVEAATRAPGGAESIELTPGTVARTAGNLLQNVAALLMHAGRPELVARDVVAILADTGSVDNACALTRAEDGSTEILAAPQHPTSLPALSTNTERTLAIGSARSRAVEVRIRPRSDIESIATVNAIRMLLGSARELERAQLEREQHLTLWPIEDMLPGDERAVITGQMQHVMSLAQKVARTSASILVTGESGTGKEIVARAIHDYSPRAQKPFVPFNCTAVPRDMLESQLFGHRRGAFTGADRDYQGLIRAAREGTLFLDEIGEMGLELQPKLLRFLESGEISPLGEAGPLTVNVRIVAATNANLEQLVHDGRFREDLFYRLNVIRLTIPPLRERRDEIPALVHHFVARAATEFSKGRVRVAEETMEHLLLHEWPGNVRQLQNELRRMVALAETDAILTPATLSPEIRRARTRPAARASGGAEMTISLNEKLAPTLARIEREMIRAALRTSHGRVEAAARELGISRKGLYLKRQRLGL
jgi:DNA-binding NtrC family response regulator